MRQTFATAAIIAIGDELTLGQTLDTNSRWLSAQLMALGIEPIEHATVPDDPAQIASTIARLAQWTGLILVTGGLGPTPDDRTREALAMALGEPLVEDAEALAQIHAWFDSRSIPMAATNRVQAQRPRSATCIPNTAGTAPGLSAILGVDPQVGTRILCLPGPPGELRAMFEHQVAPTIAGPADRVIATRTLHCFGLGESAVAQKLGDLLDRARNPIVGTTASLGVVSCRLRYAGSGPIDHANDQLDQTECAIRDALGARVFGTNDDTLASVCLDLLRAQHATLCVVESCTGGLLGAALTAIPGSSDAFVGGWTTYTNAMKHKQVGVPESIIETHGAVSAACAIAMAQGGRERANTDYALAITGIAGPDGGSGDKPVGTVWIALARRDGSADARRFHFSSGRDAIRDWSVASALGVLRLVLIGSDMSLACELERSACAVASR